MGGAGGEPSSPVERALAFLSAAGFQRTRSPMMLDRNPETRSVADAAAPVVGSEPLVTVILPVFGRNQFLDQAIQSVLGQTHRNLQLIVVDDGSPVDPIPREARFEDRIEVYRKVNGGDRKST